MSDVTTTAPDRPILRYYGGKWRLASWVISFFPEHQCYVEPYGGAASVLLRKDPAPFEVYNDLDGDVVAFFRVLRGRRRELIQALRNTPYSRAEFDQAYQTTTDELELARRFFVRAWQGYGGPRSQKMTGWKVQRRAWHSGRADQMTEWCKAKNVLAASKRFLSVQIENDGALEVIKRFDTPETLFYCDPPYPSDTRNRTWCQSAYTHELGFADHVHLANALKQLKGMAIVSTYPNRMYEELFAGWHRESRTSQTMNKTVATELLFLSPRLVERLQAEGKLGRELHSSASPNSEAIL